MAYEINGVVRIDSGSNAFLGIVSATDAAIAGVLTATLVDAKVSSKAISEQTAGQPGDVNSANELLLLDIASGGLLKITVSEFLQGAGIGTLIAELDSLTVTGVTTVATIEGFGNNSIGVGASLIPTGNELYDLGSSTNRFRDIYLSSSTIDMDGHRLGVSTTNVLVFDNEPVLVEDNIGSVSVGGSFTAQTLHGDGSAITGVGTGATGPGYTTGFYTPSTGIATFGSTTHPFLNFHTDDIRGATGATGPQGPIGNNFDVWESSFDSITVIPDTGYIKSGTEGSSFGISTNTKYINFSNFGKSSVDRTSFIEEHIQQGGNLH